MPSDVPLQEAERQFVVSTAAIRPTRVHIGVPGGWTLCHLQRRFRAWHEGDTEKPCQLCLVAFRRTER